MSGIETELEEPSERVLVVREAGLPPQDIEEENLVLEPATREEDKDDGLISESEYSPRPEDDEPADRSSAATQIHLLPELMGRLRESTSPDDSHTVEDTELSE
jgi:hypothetical protein